MIAANADRVPARHVACAEFDGIRYQAHGWLGREEKFFLGAILLKYVVLQRAAQFFPGKAALLRVDDIHSPDHGCWTINGHRSGNLVEGQAIE